MCLEGVPEKGFTEYLMRGSQGFSWDNYQASPFKLLSWVLFIEWVANEIDKRVFRGEQSGILVVGRDTPLPEGVLSIALEVLWAHLDGAHAEDCDCDLPTLVLDYVRASDEDKQKQGIRTWVEKILVLNRSVGQFPVAIAWDMGRGSLFTKNRDGLHSALAALRGKGIVGMCLPELSRLSRCKRCGMMVAHAIGDMDRRIAYPDMWGKLGEKDVRRPPDFAELSQGFAMSEKENEDRTTRSKGGMRTFARRGFAPRPRKTAFHSTRLLSREETEYRTRSKNLPHQYILLDDARDFALRCLADLRLSPTSEVLTRLAQARDSTADKLIQYIHEELFAGYPNEEGQPSKPELAVLSTPEEVEELRQLAASTVQDRPSQRESARDSLEREFGAEGLASIEARSIGEFCTLPLAEGRVCGFAWTTKVACDPHHGGKDVNVCRNPTQEHQRQFPTQKTSFEVDIQRQLGPCPACRRSGFGEWSRWRTLDSLRFKRTRCTNCAAVFTLQVAGPPRPSKKALPAKGVNSEGQTSFSDARWRDGQMGNPSETGWP